MGRSKWKGPFINFKQKKIDTQLKNNIKISRNSEIVPRYVGLTFNVYTGKLYSEITVNEDMLGHKFGEFSLTRAKFIFKKKKKK